MGSIHWPRTTVHASDRAQTRQVLDTLLRAQTNDLLLHTFRRHSARTGQTHHLRLAGRAHPTDRASETWVRGICVRVDDATTPKSAHPDTGYRNALLLLAAEPTCAIDTVYETVHLTSSNFGEVLALPANRQLAHMVHPSDLPRLRALMATTLARPGHASGPATVRFASRSGTWHPVTITATDLQISTESPRHVLCCLSLGASR